MQSLTHGKVCVNHKTNEEAGVTYDQWSRPRKVLFWTGATMAGTLMLPLLPILFIQVLLAGRKMTSELHQKDS